MKPKIVIAEDDCLILEGALRPSISSDFEIVAAVGDGRAAIDAVKSHKPEVVLLDVSMPRVRGFDAAREILVVHPECRVLFVSNYWDTAFIEAAKEMGAGGYVFKSRVMSELTPAIKAALAGDFYTSPR